MKIFLLAIFVVTAAVAFAVDDCFDEEKGKEVWQPLKEECMTQVGPDAEERVKKIFVCMYKKVGILSEDGNVLDYQKFKTAYTDAKARDLTDVFAEMDGCWNSANDMVPAFFTCWKPKLLTLCPDAKKWSEDL